MFGGGYTNGYGTWVCQFDNHTNLFNPGGYGTNAVTGTAAQLAADWVRYCNILVQTYRQGQEGLIGSDPNFNAADNAENLRVYNSVKLGGDWGGRDVLLTNGEAAVPKVIWWEVGNEPEVDLGADSTLVTQHVIADKIVYRDRYRTIANAMKAVDGSIQTGPCITAGNNNEWLGRVAEDTNAPLDFVGMHPYMGSLKWSYPNPTNMTTSLLDIGRFLADHIYEHGADAEQLRRGDAVRHQAGGLVSGTCRSSPANGTRSTGTPPRRSRARWPAGWARSNPASVMRIRTGPSSALPSWFGANYWENPAGRGVADQRLCVAAGLRGRPHPGESVARPAAGARLRAAGVAAAGVPDAADQRRQQGPSVGAELLGEPGPVGELRPDQPAVHGGAGDPALVRQARRGEFTDERDRPGLDGAGRDRERGPVELHLHRGERELCHSDLPGGRARPIGIGTPRCRWACKAAAAPGAPTA